MDGVLGDVILVNGAPWPALATDRARYRLRLLNGSNARRYTLALDPPPPGGDGLVQIGSDGGLLDSPRTHEKIDIAPAERFDVIVDFARYAPGTKVRLVNRASGGRTGEIMRFDVATGPAAADDARMPTALAAIATLDPGRAVATRDFTFRQAQGGWTINGDTYQPGRIVARPRLGTIERWRFVSDFHHPVHLHLDHFQVVSRNGGPPGPYDAGWKRNPSRPSMDFRSARPGHGASSMISLLCAHGWLRSVSITTRHAAAHGAATPAEVTAGHHRDAGRRR
jgi:FtsP/CotA-like multicopper oxidase with cupredoxin domain